MKRDCIGTSRSFAWLNVTQFLGAMNDNVFKLLVVFLLVSLLGDVNRTTVVTTASAVFVLPFLLFSHAGGVLADRLSKRRVIVSMKVMELGVMALGCAAVYVRTPLGLYAVLFAMCTQSALFGPAKYGIIPELVTSAQLSRANSQIVGLTYLAIILGTFIPSYLLLEVLDRSYLGLAGFCVAVAALGVATSLRIQRTPPAGSDKRFTPLFVVEIFRTLRETARDRNLFLAVLGAAYFVFLGGFIQQNTLLYGREALGLGWIESGYLFPVAALGIGLGAALAGVVSGRNIEFGIVPVGAAGLTLASLGLGVVTPSLLSVLALILVLGVSSGLFIVPLNAFVQYRSPAAGRGRILAANAFLSFFGVAVSAGLLAFLQRGIGLSPAACFVAAGVLTGLLTVIAVLVLPDFLVRFCIVVLTRCVYRIEVFGGDRIPVAGPAVLAPNHVTYVDSLLLGATTRRRIRFVMQREMYETSRLRPLFKLMRVIPISAGDHPRRMLRALHEARSALVSGSLLCIFPEGALTRNGNMQRFRPGLERILKGMNVPVIPVYIGGAWGSIFSFYDGRAFVRRPCRLPYPVTVQYGEPLSAAAGMADIRRAVQELSAEAFELKKRCCRALPAAFVRTARRCWFRPLVADTAGRSLRFGRALTASLALARVMRRTARGQDTIGLLLPASAGGAILNYAVALAGKTAVNLNFTASRENVDVALRECAIETVYTSRAFAGRLRHFDPPEGTVYIEDVKPRVTVRDKLCALVRALFFPASRAAYRTPAADDPATVIFSSGSTGTPKGVVLSHHNILSNIEAFSDVYRIGRRDRMCGVLPFFHAFGYTTTLWGAAVRGYSTVFHPNPLDASRIGAVVRESRCTMLLSTPTFLGRYVRRVPPEDFASLRAVITGAERLPRSTAGAFEQRFGVRPCEGYGATELSPVVSVNVPDVEEDGELLQIGNKPGSIGHPIPGVVVRVVDPETGAGLPENTEGLLLVKGPNVMREYLHAPEKTAEVLRDGWYRTGDIGRMDEDGFVTITDRLARFSKIGGEMVPHGTVEEKVSEALGLVNRAVAVTAVPDERKGEQLVLCYTDDAGGREAVCEAVQQCDLPNLWKPRRENCVHVAEIPHLASGKLDLRAIRGLADEAVAGRGKKG